MIAKISKGGSFGGAVDYVLDKGKDAELLAGLGLFLLIIRVEN